ncbi:MAG: exodeoxyribonuclease VII large subunit [Gammaproteobacteria bacterium]|nr:MAG: exodeoxyribonuclease VII large subunit [Gammaproteobacteria bacterium]
MPNMDSSQIGMDLEERQIYSVLQLNREVKQLLQQNFPLLWVEGELSNVARPASGHIYFSLKDQQAQVRCAMFRKANLGLAFQPENGMQVLVRARVGIYEPRGEYQLTIEHMEEAGVGILQRRYEALKQKLNQEGLFDPDNKQPLPSYPHAVSIVTSATGAAIRDILSVLHRRYPLLTIRIYAVPVQGNKSAAAIVDAIQEINKRKDADVVIVSRGGGSIEDLWSFNEEEVARAIYSSKIPIVAGVGHEVDFTIADFVADVRAATPTAAAELITPHQDELLETFIQYENTLLCLLRDSISNFHQAVDWMTQRLESLHPKQIIQRKQEFLIELQRRAHSAVKLKLSDRVNLLSRLSLRFESHSPHARVREAKIKLIDLHKQMHRSIQTHLQQKQQDIHALARTLDAVSPLGTLNRGYAIASHRASGQILHNSNQVSKDDEISIQVAKGHIFAKVKGKQ